MEFYGTDYVRHGSVAPEWDLQERLQLFRKDMMDAAKGKPVPGCELWRLGSMSGPIVVAINAEHTRFRGEGGALYVLIEPA